MHGLLKRYLQANTKLSTQQLDRISQLFKLKKVKRNDILLNAGDICKDLYFVNKGCIRTYYINSEGKDRTRYIAAEGMIGTSLKSFITQKPSFEFVDAIDNSELLYIGHNSFYQLVDEVDEWAVFYRSLLEHAYNHQNKRIESLVTLSAKERYDEVMKDQPEYVQRLPNHILASYLDMSQETLSRLKSK